MKKNVLCVICYSLFALFLVVGCSSRSTSNPGEVATQFLDALRQQNYSAAKAYYSENLDNFPNFKNQVETISPEFANKLFNKMSEFTYVVDKVEVDTTDTTKASVTIAMNCYDLGKAFENTMLAYIKTDLKMTFDGAKHEEIIKEVENTLLEDINNSQKTFNPKVTLTLTKEDDMWKVDNISENPTLMNALSGNILNTIDKISATLNNPS